MREELTEDLEVPTWDLEVLADLLEASTSS